MKLLISFINSSSSFSDTNSSFSSTLEGTAIAGVRYGAVWFCGKVLGTGANILVMKKSRQSANLRGRRPIH